MAGFGDGDAGGFLVDDRGFRGERGGQCVHGEVVDRSGVAAGGVVDQGDRVVGEKGVSAPGDLGVVADVVGGVGRVHAGDGVAHGDALIQCRQDTQAEAVAQGGLADE